MRLGEHNLTADPDCEDTECADPVVDQPIAETFIHENYVHNSSSQHDDIGLIRLAQPVKFTDYIRPICLPVAEHFKTRDFDGELLTVAGFGIFEDGLLNKQLSKLEPLE